MCDVKSFHFYNPHVMRCRNVQCYVSCSVQLHITAYTVYGKGKIVLVLN
jgi:hypothetical protein